MFIIWIYSPLINLEAKKLGCDPCDAVPVDDSGQRIAPGHMPPVLLDQAKVFHCFGGHYGRVIIGFLEGIPVVVAGCVDLPYVEVRGACEPGKGCE